jgi:hypothetical protein
MVMPPFPQMPPGFFHFGPPIEVVITEFVYFLLVTGLSAYIYFKTKEIYELTKHKGIYHFRNIFLFFCIAYFFRLLQIVVMYSMDIFTSPFLPREFQPLYFFFVSYFGTMAILSIIVSANIREIKIKEENLNALLHITAFVSSFIIMLIFSPFAMLLLQTLVFFVTIVMILIKSKEDKGPKLLSQNKITYVLLFIFWIFNVVSSIRRLVPREINLPLYLISVGVFFSIFLRVRKRLINAEKKRPA